MARKKEAKGKVPEDIEAWQKANELTFKIHQMNKVAKLSMNNEFKNELKNNSTSIMLNVAEGFGSTTEQEFKRYLTYAHLSSSQVQTTLNIALDENSISKKEFDSLYPLTEEIIRMIATLSQYLPEESDE
jgi:four helix bundle protein